MATSVNWADLAACRGKNPSLFFPKDSNDRRAKVEAKRICMTCSVRAQCLDEALSHEMTQGIWGGTTERERRRIRADYIRPSKALDKLKMG